MKSSEASHSIETGTERVLQVGGPDQPSSIGQPDGLAEHGRGRMSSFGRLASSGRYILGASLVCASVLFACDRGAADLQVPDDFEIVVDHVVRIGDEEGAGILTGVGVLVRRLADGRYAVADQGMLQIQIFDAEGRHLTSVGRVGFGPGEFQQPTHAWLHRSGDSLFVFDRALGRISVFSPDGKALLDTRLTQAGQPNLAVPLDDGGMLINSVRSTADGAAFPLHLVDASGRVTYSFGTEFRGGVPMGLPTHLRYTDVDEDGTLWVVPAYHERLERWLPTADPTRPWVLDTAFALETSEHFPPVTERHRWARTADDPPPSPRFRGVWKEADGPVWVNLLVAHPEYGTRLVDGSRGPEEHVPERTQEVTRVLAIDPEAGSVLAARDLSEHWSPFVGDGEAFSYGVTEVGYLYLDLWRPRLVPSTRR